MCYHHWSLTISLPHLPFLSFETGSHYVPLGVCTMIKGIFHYIQLFWGGFFFLEALSGWPHYLWVLLPQTVFQVYVPLCLAEQVLSSVIHVGTTHKICANVMDFKVSLKAAWIPAQLGLQ